MFGRECRLPDQLMPGTHATRRITRTGFALDLKERLDSAYDLIRSQQRLPCRSTDEQEPLFRVGELVLIERKRKKKGVNPKLQTKFEGPFEIKKVFSNGTYKVSSRGTVNECRLKLFVPCSDDRGQPIPDVPTRDLVDEEPDLHHRHYYTSDEDSSNSADAGISRSPPHATGRVGRERRPPAHLSEYIVY